MDFKKSINQPGLGDVHVNRPLTQIAIAYAQNPEAFIADRMFPVLPVSKKTDSYFQVPRGDWFRDEMKKRAPGALSAERTHNLSTDTYQCDVWALHEMLADQVRANYDSPLQADREITEGLTQAGMIRKELEWVTKYFVAGLWTQDFTGVSSGPTGDQVLQWNDAASNPIEDVRAAKRRVQARTGFRPNKMALGREVFDILLDHPDIVGRLDRGQTPTGPAIANRESLAALFELDEILVMDSVVNSAVEGAASDSIDFIGGRTALLVYAAPSPGLYVPSGGYTFSWTGLMGSGALGMRMKKIRDEKRESDMLEIQMAFDQKLIEADLGSFFITIVA